MVDHLFQFLSKCFKHALFIGNKTIGDKKRQHNTITDKNIGNTIANTIANTKGAKIEQLVARHLQSKGLLLLQRNFFSRYGEIDLIMLDDDTLVFVEVRYRKNHYYGGAAASVTRTKQQRIIKTALFYQQQSRGQQHMRFDVVAVEGNPVKIEWIKNAFSGF